MTDGRKPTIQKRTKTLENKKTGTTQNTNITTTSQSETIENTTETINITKRALELQQDEQITKKNTETQKH